MAYVLTGQQTSLQKREYQGLSTDTKPTLTAENTGSTFLSINVAEETTSVYLWHVDVWYKIG